MSVEPVYLEAAFEDTQKDKYLTFSIDDDIYGLEISYVLEIIGVQEITTIPVQRPYIKGVINLRGKIIPVMDIRLRFGKAYRSYDDRTCVVVLEINELTVGIIVDTVVEVLTIPEEEISAPPSFDNRNGSAFIQGIGRVEEAVKLLLNVRRLIAHEGQEIQAEGDAAVRKEH